jgi:hypothetical protein
MQQIELMTASKTSPQHRRSNETWNDVLEVLAETHNAVRVSPRDMVVHAYPTTALVLDAFQMMNMGCVEHVDIAGKSTIVGLVDNLGVGLATVWRDLNTTFEYAALTTRGSTETTAVLSTPNSEEDSESLKLDAAFADLMAAVPEEEDVNTAERRPKLRYRRAR